jgi:hypothetical protein
MTFFFSGKRYFNDILWAQAYNNNTRSLELRGIIKCTDDHIFEKTLKIELSPIPQAYTLKVFVLQNVHIYGLLLGH